MVSSAIVRLQTTFQARVVGYFETACVALIKLDHGIVFAPMVPNLFSLWSLKNENREMWLVVWEVHPNFTLIWSQPDWLRLLLSQSGEPVRGARPGVPPLSNIQCSLTWTGQRTSTANCNAPHLHWQRGVALLTAHPKLKNMAVECSDDRINGKKKEEITLTRWWRRSKLFDNANWGCVLFRCSS